MNKLLFWRSINPGDKYLYISGNNNRQLSTLGRSCQLHITKSMEGTSFQNAYTQKGNNNKKRLAYASLVKTILEYWAVCWDPH